MDSTIIAAPSSTKNKEKQRDPDAHQVKKGNAWHFGYKAHIGVDRDSGLVHTVKTTAANVHDVTVTSELLTGEEKTVNGDSGYLGADKRPEAILRNKQGKKIQYQINLRPSQIRTLSESDQNAAKKSEHKKSSVRAKVEHVFGVIKGLFRYRKTRYRGLQKQAAKLNMMFALANLIAAVLVLAMVLAHYLTKRIIEPIEKMAEDLDNIENYVPYPELSPFAHAVQTAQEQKKANEEQRREFTANVSHELKTPLTSIMGYSEMIETGLVKEEDVKIFAAKIHTEAERQLHLIGDIIQLSELDVEQSKENFVSVDLYTLAESVIEYLSFAAQKYQVSLSADGEHLLVLGNKNLLEELVYNLCDNAIRYNKPGGWVKISIYKHGERTALAVSDDGIGISPQDQARIFERFYRVDKSRSRDTGGTGLGLAIVKHIALQHEAQIFVKSLPDMGTTIEVIFKAEEEENEE